MYFPLSHLYIIRLDNAIELMSSELNDYESKSEDIILRPSKLKVTNNSLLASNEKLKSQIEDIKQAKQDSLLPSKRELVSVNKELVSTNEKFATINKQLISFSEKIKQHDITQADFINIAAYELKTLDILNYYKWILKEMIIIILTITTQLRRF